MIYNKDFEPFLSSENVSKASQLEAAYTQLDNYRSEIESYKRANEKLASESNVFKQKNRRQNEELFKKL